MEDIDAGVFEEAVDDTGSFDIVAEVGDARDEAADAADDESDFDAGLAGEVEFID